MVFARHAGVGRGGEPADRGRRQGDRLSHLFAIQPQQPRGCDGGGENSDQAAVKPVSAKAWSDRLADPSGSLVAEHDRRENILAAGAGPLGHGEAGGGQRRAGMNDVAQVAVVAGGAVTHHRVYLRRIGQWQLGASIEP